MLSIWRWPLRANHSSIILRENEDTGEKMLISLFGLAYVLAAVLVANWVEARSLGWRLMRVVSSVMPVAILFLSLDAVTLAAPNKYLLTMFLATTSLAIVLMVVSIIFEAPWRWIENVVRWASPGKTASFSRCSAVHRLALLLMVFAMVVLLWQLVLAGGVQGLEFSITEPASALFYVSANTLVYIMIAILGVGCLVRRDLSKVRIRLGLVPAKRADWLQGIAIGLGLFLAVHLATSAWQHLAPLETFTWQTNAARRLFEVFNSSLLLGISLSILAAVGEEILFRGAIQPVFGLLITSLFFTAIHLQYAFTPAAAILFSVSLVLGWLRMRRGATASIIAHAIYNMTPFVLANLGPLG